MRRHRTHPPPAATVLSQRVQEEIPEYRQSPGERTSLKLYEVIRDQSVENLADLDVGLLTFLKKAIESYLYDDDIGVLKLQDSLLDDDQKQTIEAEQRQLLSRVCRARRQRAENELRNGTPSPGDHALPQEFSDAVTQKRKWKATEVVVKVPYAYPDEKKGLVHDLIVAVYEGQQFGDVIRFPLSDPNEKEQLERAINRAKSAALKRSNKKHRDPKAYGLWVYLDDYPDGMQNWPGFSGTSVTLAVAIGVWACLQKKEVDATLAFSGVIASFEGGVSHVDSIDLKAKGSRLSGMTQLLICAESFKKEIDARESIIKAQRIQLSRHPEKRPDNTEVKSVKSLEEALAQLSPHQHSEPHPWAFGLEQARQVPGQLKPVLWALAVFLGILLVFGVIWFNLDRPEPTEFSVQKIAGESKLEISVRFEARLSPSWWLNIASVLYGRSYYWIQCQGNVTPQKLRIDSANFRGRVEYTVSESNTDMSFDLYSREGYKITAPVTIK